ncbi:MAG: metallophosphoesterase [Opitutaceae bacterium]
MPSDVIRILSDLHYGERMSRIRRLAQLRPLLDGAERIVFNGDTLDTRIGPRPQHTANCRAEVAAFDRESGLRFDFITGNHDPDFSSRHFLEFAGGQVLVTHGDILFNNLVPWSRDAAAIEKRIATAIGNAGPPESLSLEARFGIWRKVAISIPQRHQSEPDPLKCALHFIADTIWPPTRLLRVLQVWQIEPDLAAAFARRHWPRARFILTGHTHRPGIRQAPDGVVAINTGAFCSPFGGCAIDLAPSLLRVRRIGFRHGEFRLGGTVTEFRLAAS